MPPNEPTGAVPPPPRSMLLAVRIAPAASNPAARAQWKTPRSLAPYDQHQTRRSDALSREREAEHVSLSRGRRRPDVEAGGEAGRREPESGNQRQLRHHDPRHWGDAADFPFRPGAVVGAAVPP